MTALPSIAGICNALADVRFRRLGQVPATAFRFLRKAPSSEFAFTRSPCSVSDLSRDNLKACPCDRNNP
jgi:hypothetical protein